MNECTTMDRHADPKFLHYQTKERRLETFSQGAGTHHNPQLLAEAGFYHTNTKESMRCFFCGIELNEMKEIDDPFLTHALESPSCEYIRSIKRSEVKMRGQDSNKSQCPEAEATDEDDCLPSTLGGTDFSKYGLIERREFDENGEYTEATLRRNPLLTEAVQNVLKHGYLPREILPIATNIVETRGLKSLTERSILDKLPSRNEEKNNQQSSSLCEETDETREDSVELLPIMKEDIIFSTALQCRLCNATVEVLFLPCYHIASCFQCGLTIDKCPRCEISYTQKIRFKLRRLN